jgi:hypothetical protein
MSKVTIKYDVYDDVDVRVEEIVYEGDYDIQVRPEKVLVVFENKPDIAGAKGETAPHVKAVYTEWHTVLVD